MKAFPIAVLKDIEHDNDLVVGRKFNGFSEIFVVENGIARLFNRSGREHTLNAPSLTAKRLSIPDFKVQAEGIGPFPGTGSVTSILGSKPDRAVKYQEEHGPLKLMIHNFISYKGEDLTRIPFGERRVPLFGLVERLKLDAGLENVHYETLRAAGKYEFFEQIVATGGEGVVVKKLSGLESDWYKVKRLMTFDVIIVGFTAGKGKYANVIGAIRYGAYDGGGKLIDVGKCSGMTDAERGMFAVAPETFIGRVIEMRGQEIGSNGRVVFPRFVRLRDDKPAEECTLKCLSMSQINLAE